MCGVVGALVFRNSNFSVSEAYITHMRDSMVHRGPDAAGTWVSSDERVGLGHRRLSVIDLSEVANQPMSSADGEIWISFNGEIYNHASLRQELDALAMATRAGRFSTDGARSWRWCGGQTVGR